jgi:hypothetical protein
VVAKCGIWLSRQPPTAVGTGGRAVADQLAAAELAGARADHQGASILLSVISAMLEVVDVSIAKVSLVHIQANLSASLAELGWVVTGYAMASMMVIPLSN